MVGGVGFDRGPKFCEVMSNGQRAADDFVCNRCGESDNLFLRETRSSKDHLPMKPNRKLKSHHAWTEAGGRFYPHISVKEAEWAERQKDLRGVGRGGVLPSRV